MNNREAHFYLEELQRMMTQYRGIFSEEFVCANGMAILALEQERKKGKWIVHMQRGNWNDEEIRICPNCRKAFRNLDVANYCPNCGLPMEVEG